MMIPAGYMFKVGRGFYDTVLGYTVEIVSVDVVLDSDGGLVATLIAAARALSTSLRT